MSLFVGNVSKHVSLRQIETLFKKYGKCKIDLRDRYAFVQFDNESHGDIAKKELQHQTFHGLQLNIEWSKNSGRFTENNKRRDGGAQRKRSRSRQNRWRRQDRWNRRSPSNQRNSPSYSGNTDIESFVPVCPRDEIILKKLLAKAKQYQNRHKDSHKREAQIPKNHPPSTIINNTEQNHNEDKQAIQQQPHNNGLNPQIPIEEEEGAIHQDGQIPTPK